VFGYTKKKTIALKVRGFPVYHTTKD
jgi:hypothetical protein